MSTVVYTHDEHGHRADVHRPSAIDPGDYEYVGVDVLRKHKVNGGPAGTCHHCGKAIVWAVKWLHKPSDTVVTFGWICTDILGMSNDRIEHEMVLLKRQAENERKQERAKMERQDREDEFKVSHPEVVKFLDGLDDGETFDFLRDMKVAYERWGSLTDRQVASVEKCMAARQKFYAKKMEEAMNEPTIPLAEGRRLVEGEVLSHKWQPNNYGATHKMLVKQDDGNKVWGTVPREVANYCYHNAENENRDLKGLRVKFTAKVEQSSNDEHFGFFSRPNNASVVS